jgi:iron complex transport system substrate-binding protein
MRIVSLLASATEIVHGLGAGADLVGRSHECDNPEVVRSLPACTSPAFDVEMSSGEIDAEVRRRLKTGEPLYHIDAGLIRRLKPDLLITQEHCEVCAVTPGDIARSGCDSLAGQVLALSAGSVQGIYDGIHAIGAALSRREEASALVGEMQRRIDAVHASVRDNRPPTVVMLEWTDPIFSMGNWGPELVEAANGKLLLGEKGQHSRAISWNAVREADPEFLIVAPCGYGLAKSLREAPILSALPGWLDLQAVRKNQVAFADGNKFFNRSGTTIVDTVEIIAEIIHDRRGDRTWQGEAWVRYSPAAGTTAQAASVARQYTER